MNKKLNLRVIVMSSALSAVSAALQLFHLGYQAPQWGMWIDLVAVSWIMAYFMFGLRSSLLVSFLGAIIITLFAPDTWLGASMKLAATLPVIFSFYFYDRVKIKINKKFISLAVPVLAGLIWRSLIVVPANYYYAIPIWTGWSTQEAMAAIPWYIIVLFNSVQTIIDAALAYILVFRFRLNRYGSHG